MSLEVFFTISTVVCTTTTTTALKSLYCSSLVTVTGEATSPSSEDEQIELLKIRHKVRSCDIIYTLEH